MELLITDQTVNHPIMPIFTIKPKSLKSSSYKPLTNLAGEKTLHALRLGYIQLHPDPTVKLYLCVEDDKYVIRGYNEKRKMVHKILSVSTITEARKMLACMK